ncbi:MAG: DNA-binding protein [Lachnospiraceae bacterium]|nr:DNA-binding protein [Lachnospiraceae bacterium]
MEYLTTVEMSEKWGISSRRIGILCADNRIPGVIKKGKTWLIPSDAVKPVDARKKNTIPENKQGTEAKG